MCACGPIINILSPPSALQLDGVGRTVRTWRGILRYFSQLLSNCRHFRTALLQLPAASTAIANLAGSYPVPVRLRSHDRFLQLGVITGKLVELKGDLIEIIEGRNLKPVRDHDSRSQSLPRISALCPANASPPCLVTGAKSER